MKNYGTRSNDKDLANIEDTKLEALTVQVNGTTIGTYSGDTTTINLKLSMGYDDANNCLTLMLNLQN